VARDSIGIGPTPSEETCEQLGPNYNSSKALKECRVFVEQLRRVFGPEPVGARLTIKSSPHDFGTYLEVECMYDDTNEEAMAYAFRCEANTPELWDAEARAALGLPKDA
jgi:hypothetical protein